jgi:hypothetical protein
MTLDATIDTLDRIARSATDASGYFPALYGYVTRCVRDRLPSFEDPDRMARLATTFAGLYVDAFQAHTSGEKPARCWQATWDVAGDGRLLVVQHLLLGINAHVNYDLPRAVVATADATGDLGTVRGDYDHVNDILAGAFGEVVRRLDRVSRWANEAVRLGGGRLFNFSLERARAEGWRTATNLFPLAAADRRRYEAELDELVSVIAYLVTRPVFPASAFVPILRSFEQRDPRKVTAALLAAR